jgi:hypothetical protein
LSGFGPLGRCSTTRGGPSTPSQINAFNAFVAGGNRIVDIEVNSAAPRDLVIGL